MIYCTAITIITSSKLELSMHLHFLQAHFKSADEEAEKIEKQIMLVGNFFQNVLTPSSNSSTFFGWLTISIVVYILMTSWWEYGGGGGYKGMMLCLANYEL